MVVQGANGWLYLKEELTNACAPALPPEVALRRWRRIVRMVRASGRRAVLVVPPDKSSIYPANLRTDEATRKCAERGRRRLGRVLAGSPARAGVIGLRQRVLNEKRRTGRLLYRRLDTHWNHRGGLALVRAALAEVGEGVRMRPGDAVRSDDITANGDLTVLQGNPRIETAEGLVIRRRRGARRVPGRAAYLIDSFGNIVPHLLRPYFARFRTTKWSGTPSAELASRIAAADTVIFEAVERYFSLWVSREGPASPAFVELLRRRLAAAGRP
jgi:hypothetical protein